MTKSYWEQEQKRQNQLGFTFWGGTSESPELEEDFGEITNLEKAQSFPLAIASVGERLKIVQIQGSKSTVRRLREMGLVQGTELEVLNLVNGSVMFTIGNNRLGLGAEMAQRVVCANI
jgi:ferrous iron transport protein A